MADSQIVWDSPEASTGEAAPPELPIQWDEEQETPFDRVKGFAKRLAAASSKLNPNMVPQLAIAKFGLTPLDLLNDKVAGIAYDAGGKVTDVASGMGASPEVAGGAGYVANVATQALPAYLSGKGMAAVSSPRFQSLGRSLLQKAIKPSSASLESGAAQRGIDTLLKRGVSATEGGLGRLNEDIASLGRQADAVIARAAGSGAPGVSIGAPTPFINRAMTEKFGQPRPMGDVNAIRNAHLEFLRHPWLRGQTQIPLTQAQKIKKGAYQTLGPKVWTGEMQTGAVDAERAIASGMRSGIEQSVPSVRQINRELADLLNAREIMGTKALIAGNKNPIGLGLLAEDIAPGLAFMLDRSHGFKSMLARYLYSGAPNTLGVATGAGVAGRMSMTGLEGDEREKLKKDYEGLLTYSP